VKRIKHVSFEACREELQPGYTLRGEVFGVIDENGDGGIAVPLDSISDLMRHLQAQSKLEPLGRGHK